MKKTLLLSCALLLGLGISAQQVQNLRHTETPTLPVPAAMNEVHAASGLVFPVPTYSNDVIIKSDTADQQRVRISVAFNGWLYAAINRVDVTSNKGGISVLSSKDNGLTWTVMDEYFPQNTRYTTFDLIVAGTDTNSLVVYMAGVNYNTVSGDYVLFVDRYDGRTGQFIGSNFNLNAGSQKIYDVALATDYTHPAVGASPYSVGMLYSRYTSSQDSIVFRGSVDGGVTWTVNEVVAVTGYYFGKLSISYGRSASGSNGRYFGAWERRPSSIARTGNIYTSRSQSTVDGPWITPENVDSVSSTMIGLCANPQIATSFGTTDNDSASLTAVILVQRDYTGNGSDYDLLGFYNKRAHFTNFWYRLDIVNSSENDLQPDVSYDPTNQNFLAVYYDSTNSKLPYLVNNVNLTTPSSWTTINPQYNDVTTNLRGAWPRVEINPVAVQTAHAWLAFDGTGNGVAMFDAEYNHTGIANNGTVHGGMSNVFPNPASNAMTVTYTTAQDAAVSINVYNALGELVSARNLGNKPAGDYTERFDVANWNNGIYLVEVVSGDSKSVSRIVVKH
ncbi:MAG: T9SS type A sorting domain-containing protein [Bacteroidia bacterium]|nr:T9SS type A sorting domain-containing protein [Bacteroidia bacterium]